MSEPENINDPTAWKNAHKEFVDHLKFQEEDLRFQGNNLLDQSKLIQEIRMDLEHRYYKNGLTK